ncbi:MAG: bifunctional demethylmenaquinone methyltransferase/2-methoxy-6-polyprenyl-1,4-benzoquinol methylase UbiE [Bacteriovoracaceae bacterium]|nr:bifunctional demethylmenaquinone methyltransferase/2-methoxy-6-polyprenyl-1,4-benzoquinol methylase UbiE [Bacteriovoracaceae bacterium]
MQENTQDQLGERKKESYKIFDDIAGTYDPLNRFLSMGIDVYWRHRMRKELPNKDHLSILDLATGTADVPLILIKNKNVSSIRGLDMSKNMIAIGREKIAAKGLQEKINLDIGDGCNLPEPSDSWDVTTVSFGIRNFPDCFKGLQEMHRVLKPGGQVMVMEFSLPANRLIRGIYLFYFRKVLPFIGNLFSGHGDAYSYLNKTVEDFPYGQKFLDLMNQAKFHNTRAIPLTFGIATLYIGEK